LTPEQSSQLVALLQNIQLSKTTYSNGVSSQENSSNPGSATFSSFAGISKLDHTRSLCLLSCASDGQITWIIDIGASDLLEKN